MDVVVGVVCAGCFLLGLFWGAVRMASVVLAAIGAALAARLAGPAAAGLIAGTGAPPNATRVVATLVVAAVAAALVLLAGRGLRQGLAALHLSWLDRLAGGVLGAGLAAGALAILLALAVVGGTPVSSPWARGLAIFGQTVLALHSQPASSASPSSTPATPTASGQQPR